MCTARQFLQGGQFLCTQILPGQGRPHQTFLASGNSGLRDDENRIPLRYLILTQYWSVPDKRRAVKTTDNANTLISRAR